MKVAVTGSGGFIGRPLVAELSKRGIRTVALSRREQAAEFDLVQCVRAPDLDGAGDWRPFLEGCEVVVHLAGLAHVTGSRVYRGLDEALHRVNAVGTERLAQQAAACGVRHFIFMSSCHALATESGERLTEKTKSRPTTPYGRSKLAAEGAVQEAFRDRPGGFTILRPPLVYGPGQLANFARLVEWVDRCIPLPFGSIRNRRSFIAVQNLIHLVVASLGNKAARNCVYFPSDGEDLSTPALMARISEVLGKRSRLFPFPPRILRAAGKCPGLGALHKVMASLFVDSSPLQRELGWVPPLNGREGLRLALRTVGS